MLSYDFDPVQVLQAWISKKLQVDENEKPNIYFNIFNIGFSVEPIKMK